MLLANQDTELTQNHSGRKAASRNSRGRCGGPPCPERHGCQSGVSRPSLISPRRLPVVAVEPKRRRWRGRAGDRGKHDSHRPFTNRKAAPGEGTVIRARVGRPVPSGARSAQGPVHLGTMNVIKPVAGPCQEQDNPLCPRSSSQILPPIPRLRLSALRGVTLGVTVRVAALDSPVSHASAPAGRRTHATTTTTRTKKLLL